MFLWAGDRLVARVVFTGVDHRTSRVEHVPSPDGYVDAGPGLVLAVDPFTWERRDDQLASSRETGWGYRYYMLDGDRPVFTTVS